MPQVPAPYVPTVRSPLVQAGAALELAGRVRDERLAQQQERQLAAIRTALQTYPNEPDRAIEWLAKSGEPQASLTLADHVGKLRQQRATAAKTELDTRNAQAQLAIGMLNAAENNPAAWPYVLKVAETLAPHIVPLLPEKHDREAIRRLSYVTASAAEMQAMQQKGIDSLLKGEYHAGASQVLGWTQSQEQWDEGLSGLRAYGVPNEVLAQFGPTWSPQAAMRARALGLTPQQRQQAQEAQQTFDETHRANLQDEAVARRNAATSEGNLALARQRFAWDQANEPLQAFYDPITKEPRLARRSQVPKNAQPIQARGGAMAVGYGERVAKSENALVSLKRMEDLIFDKQGRMKPWLGPIQGRWTEASVVYPFMGDPSKDLAEFYAHTATLTNTVINAVTGAQMSEPEAKRITKQIPQFSDKPQLWLAKAKATRKNMQYLRKRLLELGKPELAAELMAGTDNELGIVSDDPLGIRE